VTAYFARFQPSVRPYGFIPEVPSLVEVRDQMEAEHAAGQLAAADPEAERLQMAERFIQVFGEHVDVGALLQDLYTATYDPAPGKPPPSPAPSMAVGAARGEWSWAAAKHVATMVPPGNGQAQHVVASPARMNGIMEADTRKRKTREEIEGEARRQGAKSGG
jgi:hypothetical protein